MLSLLLLTASVAVIVSSGGSSLGGGPIVGPVGGGIVPYAGGSGGCIGPSCGPDFNPQLLGGRKGYPGIRARINQRMFQYASGLVGELLNKEIQRARLPDISQSTKPMLDGCVVLYNAYVSRYRCPQRVVLYPAPPNHLVLQVQNLDVGVTGNLGGQINVLVPIALSGIAQINVHGVSLTVEVEILQGPHGPTLRVCNCIAHVEYVDVCIEDGGIIGQLANSFFRRQISDKVREELPGQLCSMLPNVVNQQINSKMGSIPQAIALTQLAALAGGSISSAPPRPSPQFCESECGIKQSALAAMGSSSSSSSGPGTAPSIPNEAYKTNSTHNVHQRSIQAGPSPIHPQTLRQPQQVVPHVSSHPHFVQPRPNLPRAIARSVLRRQKRSSSSSLPRRSPVKIVRTRGAPPQSSPSIGGPTSALSVRAPSNPLCAQCSLSGDDPAAFIRDLASNLNLAKLSDIFLSVQLMNTYATSNDFTVDLTGEFSPGGQGGTPFGAFPTMFPTPYDSHMLELVISDYTVNSLFYWMHRKGFLSFRIGPETPKIGELLKTTCSEDEDDDLEDHGVELDEEEEKRRRRRKIKKRHLRHLAQQKRTKRSTHGIVNSERVRRQEEKKGAEEEKESLSSGLGDLGICFGDILPAVREKYPNKKIYVQIHTIRAPSILLSRIQGGSAMIDLQADADIFIEGDNTKVGTITILAQINVALQLQANRIYGKGEITSLKMQDNSGTLGLPQDALDNLGSLGKELLTKLANDALSKGIPLNIAQSPSLPITFFNPQVSIVEHGLYIASDISISPALLGTLSGSGSCYRY